MVLWVSRFRAQGLQGFSSLRLKFWRGLGVVLRVFKV